MLSFYKQQLYFNQIVSKKDKITISFFMKNSKNNNIILGFSFMYLVSVYSTNRTIIYLIFFQRWSLPSQNYLRRQKILANYQNQGL